MRVRVGRGVGVIGEEVTDGDGAGAVTDPVADGLADPTAGVVLTWDDTDGVGAAGGVVAGALAVDVAAAGAVEVGALEGGVVVGAAPFTAGAPFAGETAVVDPSAEACEPVTDDEQPAITASRSTPARTVAGHGMREGSILETFPTTYRTRGMTTRPPVWSPRHMSLSVSGDASGRRRLATADPDLPYGCSKARVAFAQLGMEGEGRTRD
jgi:hypothetical protein